MKGRPLSQQGHSGRRHRRKSLEQLPEPVASMKGRPIKSGEGRDDRVGVVPLIASMKGRPFKNGDMIYGVWVPATIQPR